MVKTVNNIVWPYFSAPAAKPVIKRNLFPHRALMGAMLGFASVAVPAGAQVTDAASRDPQQLVSFSVPATNEVLPLLPLFDQTYLGSHLFDPIVPAVTPATNATTLASKPAEPIYLGKHPINDHNYTFRQKSDGKITFDLVGETEPDGLGPEIVGGYVTADGVEGQVDLYVPDPDGDNTLTHYKSRREKTGEHTSHVVTTATIEAGPNAADSRAIDEIAGEALEAAAEVAKSMVPGAASEAKPKKRRLWSTLAHAVLKPVQVLVGIPLAPITIGKYLKEEREIAAQTAYIERKNVEEHYDILHKSPGRLRAAIAAAFNPHPFPTITPRSAPIIATEEVSPSPLDALPVASASLLVADLDLSTYLPASLAPVESSENSSVNDLPSAGAPPVHHRSTHASSSGAPIFVADATPPADVKIPAAATTQNADTEIAAGDNASGAQGHTNSAPIFGSMLGIGALVSLSAGTMNRRSRTAGSILQAPPAVPVVEPPQNTVTRQVAGWTKKFAPGLLTSVATAALVGTLSHAPVAATFALAKIAFGATVAAVAASPFSILVSGIALGIGGLASFGVVNALRSRGWLHNLMHLKSGAAHATPISRAATVTQSAPEVALEPELEHVVQQVASTPTDGFLTNNLLTDDELQNVHAFVHANRADMAVTFYLEKASDLVKANTHHDPAMVQNAILYLEDGLSLARNQHVQGVLVQKLNRTMAYAERWQGIWARAADQVRDAFMPPRAAGNAMDNIGGSFMPVPAPV